ncbi:MAG: hypothetical protein HGA45_28595 [Chloroflexales bacterium]|nr:hypothetical protein [Chloroflexales bacterium]
MSTIDERESARYRQDVLLSYRAWLAYLEAQQTILAAASDTQAIDPFEGASAHHERADAARQRILALPADKRELFEAIYDQERAQVQRELDAEAQVRGGTVKRADPDEVARLALTRLHEEARGLHRDDRRGLVPRGKPDAVKWLGLDLAELEAAPPAETDYQVVGGLPQARRGMILNLVFAGLALLAIPLVLFLLRPGDQGAVTAHAATGNGAALAPWGVVAVHDGAHTWSLPVQESATRWAEACRQGADQACWLQGSSRPLRLCVPETQLSVAEALVLDAPNGLPARTFALSRQGVTDADLVVAPCASNASPDATRYGTLQSLQPQPFLAPGDAAPAGFQVVAMTTRGRGEDPAIPEGQQILEVTVAEQAAAAERDWVAGAPTLLLADGSAALPSSTREEEGTIHFDYLIPDQSERFDVVWQATPAAGQLVRYRTTLEPPPTRDSVLRAGLRVQSLAVTPSQQTMTVRFTARNAATSPLVVLPADLGYQTQTGRRDVAAAALQQPLAPQTERSVTIDLPLESGVLQIGPLRYQLTVRR